MDTVSILFHGEVQLVDWSDTRAAGPCIKLRFADPSSLDVFRGMDTAGRNKTGHILNVTIAEGDIASLAPRDGASDDAVAKGPAKGPFADASSLLWKSAFFRTPRVWQALGCYEACEKLRKESDIRAAQTHAWDFLKRHLGHESMSEASPEDVIEWAKSAQVLLYLPKGYGGLA